MSFKDKNKKKQAQRTHDGLTHISLQMDLYLNFTNFHVGIHSLKFSYLMPLHFGHLILQLCFDGKMVDITSNLERALPLDNNFFCTEQAGHKKTVLNFPIFCNTAHF